MHDEGWVVLAAAYISQHIRPWGMLVADSTAACVTGTYGMRHEPNRGMITDW